MHILNDDLHFPHLPTTCCSRRSNFHLEPWVKTSSWSPADLLLVSPHRGVRKAWASTAWQICYDNDLIFQRCSLNRAYMVRENANIVQRKPSLCLLNDPEWLHCNGPIWSVQQGLEEARETVRAESEWWRPSSWECFQSRLCRHKTKHVSSTGAHHTYIPSPAFTPSIWVFFSVPAFRRSSASQGVWAWPFSSAKKLSDSLSQWCYSSLSAVKLMAVQAFHRTGFSWTWARELSPTWQIRTSTTQSYLTNMQTGKWFTNPPPQINK